MTTGHELLDLAIAISGMLVIQTIFIVFMFRKKE